MFLPGAHASLMNFQGTGNYTQTGGNVVGSTIIDTSFNDGMAFNNSDTTALLGYGGFDTFDLTVGETLHFWYNEALSGDLVDLHGTISSVDIANFSNFSFFGVNSLSGDIYEVSGSTSYFGDNVVSNSINVSGQYGNVPEPSSIALFSVASAGLFFSRKKKKVTSSFDLPLSA